MYAELVKEDLYDKYPHHGGRKTPYITTTSCETHDVLQKEQMVLQGTQKETRRAIPSPSEY